MMFVLREAKFRRHYPRPGFSQSAIAAMLAVYPAIAAAKRRFRAGCGFASQPHNAIAHGL
jgi:hypothetical protein